MNSKNGGSVAEAVLALQGGDRFAWVAAAAHEHRERHGPDCGLYPAGPMVMTLVSAFVRAAGPRSLLDLGCGFGYSTLWLSASAPADATVHAVDCFAEHVDQAEHFARQSRLHRTMCFYAADACAYLAGADERYDFIHDDAWFAKEPSYLELMLERLRPGGVLTMANWFLLVDALAGDPDRDWRAFGGPSWRKDTLAYARRLAEHPGLDMVWAIDPPLGVATKR